MSIYSFREGKTKNEHHTACTHVKALLLGNFLYERLQVYNINLANVHVDNRHANKAIRAASKEAPTITCLHMGVNKRICCCEVLSLEGDRFWSEQLAWASPAGCDCCRYRCCYALTAVVLVGGWSVTKFLASNQICGPALRASCSNGLVGVIIRRARLSPTCLFILDSHIHQTRNLTSCSCMARLDSPS